MDISKWWPLYKKDQGPNGATATLSNPNGANGATLDGTHDLHDSPDKKRVVYIDDPNSWIKNDGLLRDEGVLFGLSGAAITEKLASINNYYDQQKASFVSAQKFAQEQLQNLEKELASSQNLLGEKQTELQKPNAIFTEVFPGKVVRYFLGLALMVVAAVGSFYLLHYYITPRYGGWATCGVFFFGLFAQMAPISSWLRPEEESTTKSKYREWLLEVGPSAVATLLTSYLVFTQSEDAVLAVVLGLFLLFLFFFNGKLILALSQTLVGEAKGLNKFLRIRKAEKRKKADLKEEIGKLQEKEKQQLEGIKAIQGQIKEASTKLNELEEEKKNKVNLFTSEYNLARHFSTTLKTEDHAS